MKSVSYCRKAWATGLIMCILFTLITPSFVGAAETNESIDPQPTKVYTSGTCENGELNYLCFGDSMTNGFGLPGYDEDNGTDPESHAGFKFAIAGAYPDIVASEINEKYGCKVNLFQYSFTATRLDDILAFISTDNVSDQNYFGGDAYTELYIKEQRIDKLYDNSVVQGLVDVGNKTQRINAKFEYGRKDFAAAVKKADVISVCLGMNNFICYLRERINAYTGETMISGESAGRNAYDLSVVLSPGAKSLYDKLDRTLTKELEKQAGKETAATVSDIIGDALYGVAGLGTNYVRFCNRLYELNPDADVILIGFPYGTNEIYLTIDVPIGKKTREVTIDFGKISQALIGVINAHIKYQALSYEGNAVYSEYGDVDLIYQEMAKLESGGSVDFNEEYEIRMLTSSLGTLFKDIGKTLVKAIAGTRFNNNQEFNKDNIKKGVAYIQGETGGDEAYALPGQVYLGMRDAIIDVLNYDEKNKFNHINVGKAYDFLVEKDGKTAYDELFSGEVLAGLQSAAQTMTKPVTPGSSAKDQSLREEVARVLKTEGSADLIFAFARALMDNSYTSHTSLSGHQQVATRVLTAYDKLQKKKKVKQVLKKAVPVMVGGAAVTMITASIARNLAARA